jgi:hypothetical protein
MQADLLVAINGEQYCRDYNDSLCHELPGLKPRQLCAADAFQSSWPLTALFGTGR